MAKTYAKIQEQIAKLQREATLLRDKEVRGVVGRIKEAIAHYELTAQDLFGTPTGARKAATQKPKSGPREVTSKKGAARGKRVPVKYRDDAGNTWTGRGNKPRWLVAALADGKKLEEYLVKA